MARYAWSGLATALILAGVVLLGCAPSPEPVVAEAPPAVAEPPAAAVSDADLKALVEGNNQFAIELYKKIAETETGNICISPYSISAAL